MPRPSKSDVAAGLGLEIVLLYSFSGKANVQLAQVGFKRRKIALLVRAIWVI